MTEQLKEQFAENSQETLGNDENRELKELKGPADVQRLKSANVKVLSKEYDNGNLNPSEYLMLLKGSKEFKALQTKLPGFVLEGILKGNGLEGMKTEASQRQIANFLKGFCYYEHTVDSLVAYINFAKNKLKREPKSVRLSQDLKHANSTDYGVITVDFGNDEKIFYHINTMEPINWKTDQKLQFPSVGSREIVREKSEVKVSDMVTFGRDQFISESMFSPEELAKLQDVQKVPAGTRIFIQSGVDVRNVVGEEGAKWQKTVFDIVVRGKMELLEEMQDQVGGKLTPEMKAHLIEKREFFSAMLTNFPKLEATLGKRTEKIITGNSMDAGNAYLAVNRALEGLFRIGRTDLAPSFNFKKAGRPSDRSEEERKAMGNKNIPKNQLDSATDVDRFTRVTLAVPAERKTEIINPDVDNFLSTLDLGAMTKDIPFDVVSVSTDIVFPEIILKDMENLGQQEIVAKLESILKTVQVPEQLKTYIMTKINEIRVSDPRKAQVLGSHCSAFLKLVGSGTLHGMMDKYGNERLKSLTFSSRRWQKEERKDYHIDAKVTRSKPLGRPVLMTFGADKSLLSEVPHAGFAVLDQNTTEVMGQILNSPKMSDDAMRGFVDSIVGRLIGHWTYGKSTGPENGQHESTRGRFTEKLLKVPGKQMDDKQAFMTFLQSYDTKNQSEFLSYFLTKVKSLPELAN